MNPVDTILCSCCCAQSPATSSYCGECGAELATSGIAGPPDEIRVVTVLFADVADFTELSAQLGLEAVKDLMDRVFERLYQVLVRHGGVVDKYIGDCVMALFGAPIALGDDPARAVRAGLAMLRTLQQMRPELEAAGLPPIQLRIAVNTGPVVAGAVGAGPQRRYTVMGHAVNVAAHLQRAIPRGCVAISAGTYRRVRGLFELRPIDGVAPLAHQVLSHRVGGLWLRPREILGSEVELVGRRNELDRLLRLARSCRQDGRARVAVVVGEPGVGKTRVGTEFLSAIEQQAGHVCIVGHADPLSVGAPFAVVADAVRHKLVPAGQPATEALDRLRSFMRQSGCELLPGDGEILGRVLGLPQTGARRTPGGECPPDPLAEQRNPIDPALFSRRSTQLLTDLLERMTRIVPVVIVIEDLQWCDASTLELLDHLAARLRDRPLMLVGLTRPELMRDPGATTPGPFHRAADERIELGPLSESEVAELLDRAVGRAVRQRLLGLVSSALGNPFHVEELLRTLEDRGLLLRRVSGWRLGRLPDDLGLPPQVEAVAQVRIDSLTASQRALLRTAALVGRSFWEGALRAVAGDDFNASDLSTLVQRELVVRVPESRFAGDREYRFLHEVTREVAYRMLPEPQRCSLHRHAARWLQRQGAATAEDLALIGLHLERCGDHAGAAEQLERAGDDAYEAAAYRLALGHFSRAIDLAGDDPELAFGLYARRERAFNALGRWADQRADAERLLELAPEPDQRRMEALLRLGRALLNLGDHQQAMSSFEQALELARGLQIPEGTARALRWLGMYHFNRSEHAAALPLFNEALRVAEEAGVERLAAELAYELGVTVGTVGDYVRALEVSQRALAMFREQGNRYQEAFCLGNLGCFHAYLGEYEEAVESLQLSARLGRQMGIPLALASAEANLGNAFRLMGDTTRALQLEDRAREVAWRLGDLRLNADACLYGSLAALDSGDPQRAEQLIGEALRLAREGDMGGTEAVALMARARWLLLSDSPGHLAEALELSLQATVILGRLGSVEGFESEIWLTYAEVCRRLGREDQRREILELAQADLLRKAARIESPERRRRFLAGVAANAALLRLHAETLASDGRPVPGVEASQADRV